MWASGGYFRDHPGCVGRCSTIELEVKIDNDSVEAATIEAITQLFALDAEGQKSGRTVASFEPRSIAVAAGSSATINGFLSLPNPRLWDPLPTQTPHRYLAVTTLYRQGEAVDQYETRWASGPCVSMQKKAFL